MDQHSINTKTNKNSMLISQEFWLLFLKCAAAASRNRKSNIPLMLSFSFFAVFFMGNDGTAKLDFIQNMEYKFLELLSLDFHASSEEIVRQNISFRYSVLKAKDQILQNRLKDISSIIKIKNPTLLTQLQRDMQPKPLQVRNTNR